MLGKIGCLLVRDVAIWGIEEDHDRDDFYDFFCVQDERKKEKMKRGRDTLQEMSDEWLDNNHARRIEESKKLQGIRYICPSCGVQAYFPITANDTYFELKGLLCRECVVGMDEDLVYME